MTPPALSPTASVARHEPCATRRPLYVRDRHAQDHYLRLEYYADGRIARQKRTRAEEAASASQGVEAGRQLQAVGAHEAGVGEHLPGRAVGDDLAVVEHQ